MVEGALVEKSLAVVKGVREVVNVGGVDRNVIVGRLVPSDKALVVMNGVTVSRAVTGGRGRVVKVDGSMGAFDDSGC